MLSNYSKARRRAFASCFLSLLFPIFATAQNTTPPADVSSTQPTDAPTDENGVVKMDPFTVKGFRSSLDSSLADKRNSSQVLDAITAEQMGQFGSQDVGEAIQRISGVSLSRNNGEGQFISVRGMAPNFTRVEIDGRSTFLTSDQSDPGRAVLLSAFSSDLYSKIEVIKSPTAADVEGGAGGTVRLSTPEPLDVGKLHWGVKAQLGHAELRDKNEPNFSAYFVNVTDDKRLGILLAATYEKRDRRLDKVQMGDPIWAVTDSTDPSLAGGRYPERLRLESRRGDNPKLNLNAKIQFQATPELQLYANTVLTREKRTEKKSRIQIGFDRGTIQSGTLDPETGTITSAEFKKQRADYNDFWRDTKVDTTGVTGGFIWQPNLWKVKGKASYSDGKEDFDEYRIQARVNKDGTGGYDLGDNPRTPSLYTASTMLPLDQIDLRNLDDNARLTDISERELQLDANRSLEHGAFTAFQFGARYADTAFKRRQGGPPAADVSGLTMADAMSPFILTGDFGFGKAGPDFLTMWPEGDPKQMYFKYAPGGDTVYNDSNYYTIHEKNAAGYVMADFNHKAGDANIKGNIGLRYVRTKFAGNGRVTLTSTTQTYVLDDQPALDASYTEPLPAFNIVIQPHYGSNVQIRAAITRAMTRPTVSQINPSIQIDAVDANITKGNPDLSPFLAWQYDLGVEYYFGKNHEGLFSVSGFFKDVDNFIVPEATTENIAYPDQGIPAQDYSVDTFRNGGKAKVKGFEVNLQTPFTFLDGFLSNFGTALNYTYTDSEFTDAFGHSFTFPGASKNTYNASLYYEKGIFSARASYNYRGKYLDTPTSESDGSNTRYGDAQGRLDFSLRLRYANGIRFTFDALNLTRAQSYIYYDTPQRYQNFEFEGRVLLFGVGYDF